MFEDIGCKLPEWTSEIGWIIHAKNPEIRVHQTLRMRFANRMQMEMKQQEMCIQPNVTDQTIDGDSKGHYMHRDNYYIEC